MRRKSNEFLYKCLVLIILISILLITLFSNTQHSKIDKKTILNEINTKDVVLNQADSIPENIKNTIFDEISFNKKILYISRHGGTIANFKKVTQLLSLPITIMRPPYLFEERPACYKIDRCKIYVRTICDKYDYIVVSDIIPDAYVYLTNYCRSKIVLEITNRFDMFVYYQNFKGEDENEYYKQFGHAIMNNKNVIVVENNPFETFYACQKKVYIPNYFIIRPIGYSPIDVIDDKDNVYHDVIGVINSSYQDDKITIPELKKYNIPYKKLLHQYGGPLVLATYKAIIILPYQVSVMKMMENFRYGVAMILPSKELLKKLCEDRKYEFAAKDIVKNLENVEKYVEWYNHDFDGLFVYFDSWEELPDIIKNTDFDALKEKEKKFMEEYEKKALNLWAQVFDIFPETDMIKNTEPLCNTKEFLNYNRKY